MLMIHPPRINIFAMFLPINNNILTSILEFDFWKFCNVIRPIPVWSAKNLRIYHCIDVIWIIFITSKNPFNNRDTSSMEFTFTSQLFVLLMLTGLLRVLLILSPLFYYLFIFLLFCYIKIFPFFQSWKTSSKIA